MLLLLLCVRAIVFAVVEGEEELFCSALLSLLSNTSCLAVCHVGNTGIGCAGTWLDVVGELVVSLSSELLLKTNFLACRQVGSGGCLLVLFSLSSLVNSCRAISVDSSDIGIEGVIGVVGVFAVVCVREIVIFGGVVHALLIVAVLKLLFVSESVLSGVVALIVGVCFVVGAAIAVVVVVVCGGLPRGLRGSKKCSRFS